MIVILLEAGPQNNAKIKPVCGATKVANPWVW